VLHQKINVTLEGNKKVLKSSPMKHSPQNTEYKSAAVALLFEILTLLSKGVAIFITLLLSSLKKVLAKWLET